jgi:hypothetical protein
MGHEIVGTSDFEAEDLQDIVAFEPYLVSELCAEIGGQYKRGFLDDLVDF